MILVLGDINLDIIVNLREDINFNTDSESDIHFEGGGSAANFSYWLDYLEQPVRFVAKTGGDFIVDYLKKQFQNTKIDFINLVSKNKETGRIVILLSKSGDRTMVTDRGANLDFSPEDITNDYFKGIEHLHLGGYSFFGGKNMEETSIKTIKKAKQNNIKVSFDPSSYSGLNSYGTQNILNQTKGVDFCFPNIDEGRVLANEEDPEKIVHVLLNYYKNVVLKLGEEGCYIGNQDFIKKIKQKRKLADGDTTGAGDAFTAAFLTDYLNNGILQSAAEKANEVAFKCVKKIGGRPPEL